MTYEAPNFEWKSNCGFYGAVEVGTEGVILYFDNGRGWEPVGHYEILEYAKQSVENRTDWPYNPADFM